ncbi:MAG: hypothetical protein OEZ06_08310 [Myxococcales bacterium]|nr:hypothetical protein [Myxococcales bacterium]
MPEGFRGSWPLLCATLACALSLPTKAQQPPLAPTPTQATPQHSQPAASPPTAPRTGPPTPGRPPPARVALAPNGHAALRRFLAQRSDSQGRRCSVLAIQQQGVRYRVACGNAGLWTVEATRDGGFAVLDTSDLGGSAVGFFTHGDKLWVEVQRLQAVPVGDVMTAQPPPAAATPPVMGPPPLQAVPPAPPGAATPPRRPALPPAVAPPAPARRRDRGKVIAVGPGYVDIDLGYKDGLGEGERVALLGSETSFDGSSLAGGVEREQTVGRVVDLSPNRGRVELGLNEAGQLGQAVRVTERPLSASRISPHRAAGIWELAALVRPFLIMDELGGGVLLDARAGFRSEDSYHIEAAIQPLALATAGDGGSAPMAAIITGGYDVHMFEVGLGLGGQTVHDVRLGSEPGSGTSIIQRLRVGARDGLHLEAWNHVTLFRSEFDWSAIRISGQLPISRGTWLRMTGSGGTLGVGFGEIGVRTLLRGNGGPDTLFLEATIGGVHVFEDPPRCQDFDCPAGLDYAGPMVGLGAEWRM